MTAQSTQRSIWVTAAADVTNPNGFGGLPYHLLQSGKANQLFSGGMAFKPDDTLIKLSRLLWNGTQYLRTGRYGGFQYSETFLNRLWATAKRPQGSDANTAFLNIFQLFPMKEMLRPSKKYFYLDQTLHEVFDYYGTGLTLPEKMRKDILRREKTQYHAAEKVIFRSHWAANLAIANYDLPPDKVHVVLPGANIDPQILHDFDSRDFTPSQAGEALQLIFIGKEWKRKGLDRLLGAMRLCQDRGAKINLRVIGTSEQEVPTELTNGLQIDWLGFVDKSREPQKFVSLTAQSDLGILLSRFEAGGVSLREFGRLGIPALAPNTGGSPEFADSDPAFLFDPDAPNKAIADLLHDLATDRNRLNALKNASWQRRMAFDWTQATEKLAIHLQEKQVGH